MNHRGRIEVPVDIEHVSARWLSEALTRAFPGIEVAAVSPESLHQGTASTWRLHLTYANDVGAPPTMCIKSGFVEPERERLTRAGLYRKEVVVYLDVLPATAARVATCFSAGHDDRGHGYMLLEDVVAAGGRFCDPVTGLSFDQVAAGLGQLAELHAARWDDPSLSEAQWQHHRRALDEPDPFWIALFDQYDDTLQTPHGGVVPLAFQDADVVSAAFTELRALDAPRARCLIHGDAHVGNFFVNRDGEPRMADFQCVQRGHFSHDLAMFVASALDIVERPRHEQTLLHHYHDHLQRLVVKPPDFHEVWLGYRQHLLYALVVWLFTTSDFQPTPHLVTNVTRYGMAGLDLDTLGAIRQKT